MNHATSSWRTRAAHALTAIALFAAAVSVGGLPTTVAFAADAGAGTATYDVEVVAISTGPDGGSETATEAGTLVVACAGTDCRVINGPRSGPLSQFEFAAGATLTAASESPGAATACQPGGGPTRITMTADAASMSATMVQEPLGWDECENGSQAYTHAQRITWAGALVAADPCVFAPAGCLAAPAAPVTGAGGASRIADGDPAAPSVLSALATPAGAGTEPAQLGLAAILAVVLVLLMAFPTSLLNSAVDAGTDRWSTWRRERRARRAGPLEAPHDTGRTPAALAAQATAPATDDSTAPAPDAVAAAAREPSPRPRGWGAALAAVAAAGLLSAFVDPGFGFNPGSVRVLLSLLVSLAIEVVLGWLIVIWIVRRTLPDATHRFTAKPFTLLIVLAAVIFTRVTGFEPGIVFGLVAGVSFTLLTRTAATAARMALIPLGYAFGLGLIGWAGYGLIGGPAASGDSVALTFVADTLSSLAIGGMVALPLALMPVRGLTGHTVWSWNRYVWAGCYAVGLFAFFVVLMPMPVSWGEVPFTLATWVSLYLAYALTAVAAWLVLVRPWRQGRTGAEAATGPAPETPVPVSPVPVPPAMPTEPDAAASAATARD